MQSTRRTSGLEEDRVAIDNRDIIIVLTNLPDRATATRLASLLVERRHAACVNAAGLPAYLDWVATQSVVE